MYVESWVPFKFIPWGSFFFTFFSSCACMAQIIHDDDVIYIITTIKSINTQYMIYNCWRCWCLFLGDIYIHVLFKISWCDVTLLLILYAWCDVTLQAAAMHKILNACTCKARTTGVLHILVEMFPLKHLPTKYLFFKKGRQLRDLACFLLDETNEKTLV
jgi:hypothetical protein